LKLSCSVRLLTELLAKLNTRKISCSIKFAKINTREKNSKFRRIVTLAVVDIKETLQGELKNFIHYVYATKYKLVVITLFFNVM